MLPPTEKHKIKSGYMESYMYMCLPKTDNKKKIMLTLHSCHQLLLTCLKLNRNSIFRIISDHS